jgi:hypothetical protein
MRENEEDGRGRWREREEGGRRREEGRWRRGDGGGEMEEGRWRRERWEESACPITWCRRCRSTSYRVRRSSSMLCSRPGGIIDNIEGDVNREGTLICRTRESVCVRKRERERERERERKGVHGKLQDSLVDGFVRSLGSQQKFRWIVLWGRGRKGVYGKMQTRSSMLFFSTTGDRESGRKGL